MDYLRHQLQPQQHLKRVDFLAQRVQLQVVELDLVVNMVKLLPVKIPDNKFMEQIGFSWHTDPDNTPYIANEIVQITPKEADAYYEAVNELYDMFSEAGEHIIKNNMLHEIGVPFNLIAL